MDDQANRPALRDVTDALDASVRDLESGAVCDAISVQTEARRMLADYDRAHPGSPGSAGRNSPKRSRTA
jgi:hypothetical protein